jgi:hypothetical protein
VSVSTLFDSAVVTETDGRLIQVRPRAAIVACVYRIGSLQDDRFQEVDERRAD